MQIFDIRPEGYLNISKYLYQTGRLSTFATLAGAKSVNAAGSQAVGVAGGQAVDVGKAQEEIILRL